MNTPASLELEVIPMESFYSDVQPQPIFLRGDDPNFIEYERGCNVTVFKDKGIMISSSIEGESWTFNLPKSDIINAEMQIQGYHGSSITIYFKDPKGIQEHFYARMFSQTMYDVKTLGKRIKEELEVEVKELK